MKFSSILFDCPQLIQSIQNSLTIITRLGIFLRFSVRVGTLDLDVK